MYDSTISNETTVGKATSRGANFFLRSTIAALLMTPAMGCAGADQMESEELSDPASEAEIGSTEQAISGGTWINPGDPEARHVVNINYGSCTGTIVGTRFVLTAAHCGVVAGNAVIFYDSAWPDYSLTRKVKRVFVPDGVVNGGHGDSNQRDRNGKHADIVVLELSDKIPSSHALAWLPDTYPGNNVWGSAVGTGDHNGRDNPNLWMAKRDFKTYSSNDGDGHFLTDQADVNGGDSGGPFFNWNSGGPMIQGTLTGTRFEWALRGKYTSVAYHLDRILYAMGLNKPEIGWDFPGYDYYAFYTSARHCAIVCAQDDKCNAYTHYAGVCWLKDNGWGNVTRLSGAVSGTKASISCQLAQCPM